MYLHNFFLNSSAPEAEKHLPTLLGAVKAALLDYGNGCYNQLNEVCFLDCYKPINLVTNWDMITVGLMETGIKEVWTFQIKGYGELEIHLVDDEE